MLKPVSYEQVVARGHPNIRATHKTTFEVTKEPDLAPRGDCIIGVAANKSPADFSREFKESLRNHSSILLIVLEAGDMRDVVVAHGHPSLLLSDPKKLIVRRSDFIEPATIGIHATKAAANLRRNLVAVLKDPSVELVVHLYTLRLNDIAPVHAEPR